jgi:hypothetical protein
MPNNARHELTREEIGTRYKQRFEILVRYLILAAENKRFVTYGEINKGIGISLEMMGFFCAHVGNFCRSEAEKLPPLNSLVVNARGMPESGYFDWLGKENNDYADWGRHVHECFKHFYVSERLDSRNVKDIITRVDNYLA